MAKKNLSKTIRKALTKITSDLKKDANASDKPRHIMVDARSYEKGGAVDITITAKSPKGDARAYEYGSGIHSRLPNVSPKQEGSRGYIIIAPKAPKKLLAFHWDTMNQIMEVFGEEAVREALRYSHKFKGFSDDGRYLFKYVEHPGVEAANGGKGYIGPAVTKARAKIRRQIPDAVKKHVVNEIRRVFKQEGQLEEEDYGE